MSFVWLILYLQFQQLFSAILPLSRDMNRNELLAALIFFSTVFALLKTRSFIDFSDSNIQITSVSVFNNFIQCGIIHSRNKRIRVVFFVFYYTSDSFVQRRKTDPFILSKNNSLQYRVSARDNFFIS